MGQSVAERQKPRKPSAVANPVDYSVFQTACGWMGIAGKNETVHHLRLGYEDPQSLREDLCHTSEESVESDWFPTLREKLQAYASGQRVSFTGIRYHLHAQTDFQQAVLRFVHRLPYGHVLSYGEVAEKVGYPGAARAVGTVMAHNRIPLIIPCHRVIGSGGKLGGFSAPHGIGLKQWLLDLEQASLSKRPR